MIFSSQPGNLDGLSNEQAIKHLANHLRKMQEELEYRLANLDSSNIGEINADDTNIFAQGKNINNIITDQEGRMSQFQMTVEGFNNTVSEYGKSVTQFQQTVDGFRMTVDNYGNKVSEYTQTVDGFTKTVTDYEKGVSQYKQTVDGFTTQVSNYEKQYSSWEQTVEGFNQTVSDYEKGYSTWEQTVDGFTQQVSDYEGAVSGYQQAVDGFKWTVDNLQTTMGTTLKLDETGLYIIDQDGNVVMISGSQIDATTIRVSNLYGKNIYLKSQDKSDIGWFSVTGGTSAENAVELFSTGALRLIGRDGDAFLGSYNGYATLSGARGNTSQGNFFPSASDTYTLGTSYYKWSDIYAVNGEITTSDREKKNSIDYNMERYEKFFDLLKPCSYKLNSGTSDRIHVNMISQDVEEALAEAGLTSKDFAGFIKSPRKDKDGNKIEGEYDYALRYSEFVGLCIAEIQKLKGRIEELERKEQDNGQAG